MKIILIAIITSFFLYTPAKAEVESIDLCEVTSCYNGPSFELQIKDHRWTKKKIEENLSSDTLDTLAAAAALANALRGKLFEYNKSF